jgi:AraC-like DNA-binding protein
MSRHNQISEKHILAPGFERRVVRADATDPRPWMQQAPICTQLSQHRIAHCGILRSGHPIDISRRELSGTFFLGCLQGVGRVWIDGAWHKVGKGYACIQPPFIANSINSLPKSNWEFCWVRYRESKRVKPMVSVHTPVYAPYDSAPLGHAIRGLIDEASGRRSNTFMQRWVDLIQSYVMMFAQPYLSDDRLESSWNLVEEDLKEPWTIERLAKLAKMSREHLRRVSIETIGRAPMQHVTFLRLRRAAQLLSEHKLGVAEIAEEVGYSSSNAFSDTFQRWSGLRPAFFREKMAAGY